MLSQHKLPSSRQEWAHSTCTVAQMRSAMTDTSITAVEADILMGTTLRCNVDVDWNAKSPEPIMAHPPDRESDLSFAGFMELATHGGTLRKHIKLDFKEIETIAPSLSILRNLNFNSNGKTIFLNADIIAGPGRTADDITVPADLFLDHCHGAITKMNKKTFVFSLGFKVDVCSIFGHTKQEVAEMVKLIQAYKVHKGARIVLAINARLLVKNMSPFGSFLVDFPESQLCCWVGSGEPPISRMKLRRIRNFFESRGIGERIGFDVQTTSLAMGVTYDIMMWFMGLYHLFQAKISVLFETSKAKAS